jgi:BirA family biotin operon repressor/biotin-[acetyl-CoA-carboxylase] ligase
MSPSSRASFYHLSFETLASTHRWCKAQNDYIYKNLLVYDYLIVSAKHQTEGVGRLEKSWLSCPGNISFNLNLKDPLSESSLVYSRLIEIPCAVSWAICQVIQDYGVECYVKWPNDIITAKGKLGGCIVERNSSKNHLTLPEAWLSLGVGLNIYPPDNLPNQSIDQPIDYLSNYNLNLDSTSLTEILSCKIYHQLKSLTTMPFSFDQILLSPLYRKDSLVQLHTPLGIIEGTIKGIDSSGRLQIIDSNHQTRCFTSGECSMLRSLNQKGVI